MKKFNYIVAFFLALVLGGSFAFGQVSHLVISQVYGGGGNSGATYGEDFIEIFNPTGSAVSLNGWSVQYASAAGSSWTVTALTNYSLAAGQYYLIGEFNNGAPALPTCDATGTTNLAQAAGKVALCNSTAALSGTCPTGGSIVDFIGYGSTANCYEGTSYAPSANSSTSSDMRANSGCTDTDQNSTDFSSATPAARNTASATHPCATCTAPTTQATIGAYTNNTTGNSITVNWSRGNGTAGVIVVARLTSTTGVDPTSGTSYTANAAFGSGNTTGAGNYVVYKGTGTSVNVTALSASTAYTFTVYEYNTTSTCYDVPGSSSGVTTFGSYCTNTNTTNTSYYVDDFSTTGGSTNITNNSSGFHANGYNYYTGSASYTVTANIGVTINFSVTGDAGGGTYGFGIWVDWNQNGSFADAGEQMYISGAYLATTTGSFTVPAGALTGPTRMRVVGDWLTTTPVACPGTSYSECEDYTFNVTASTCAIPTTQASSLTFSGLGCTSITASWTNGNGSKRIVKCNTANSWTAPVNGTDPSANPVYAGGEQVVYNGTGSSATVTGLTAGTTYWFKVYEANCSGSTIGWATATGTNNPLSQATSPATPATPGAITGTGAQCPNATGQAYSITAVANASIYNWTVPTGWTISGGQGTNAITVITGNTGQGGSITVTAGNSCGTSAAQTLPVTISASVPTAGPDQYVCYAANLTVTMAANNITGTWSMISGPSTPTIVTPSAYNSVIGAAGAYLTHGTYIFRWSTSCSGSYDDVIIIVQ